MSFPCPIASNALNFKYDFRGEPALEMLLLHQCMLNGRGLCSPSVKAALCSPDAVAALLLQPLSLGWGMGKLEVASVEQ